MTTTRAARAVRVRFLPFERISNIPGDTEFSEVHMNGELVGEIVKNVGTGPLLTVRTYVVDSYDVDLHNMESAVPFHVRDYGGDARAALAAAKAFTRKLLTGRS